MLNYLLYQLIAWLSVDAVSRKASRSAPADVRRIDLTPGRVVSCTKLPKQRTDHLERIASVFSNSLCEILDPPFDDKFKIRLRWLGDEQVCGAVNPRYIKSVVPLVYVHYIEDHDGSERDKNLTRKLFDELALKLNKDITQTVTAYLWFPHADTENLHVLTTMQWNEFRQTFRSEPSTTALYTDEVFQRMLDWKLIPMTHRIHENTDIVQGWRSTMEGIGQNANPKQLYRPLQRPALRIHLFSDEWSFVHYGDELYDKIMNDSRQIAMLATSDPQKMERWWWYWYAVNSFSNQVSKCELQRGRLLAAYSQTVSDPEVWNDKNRLSRTLQILFRNIGQDTFPDLHRVLERMAHLQGFKTTNQVRGIIGKIKNVIDLVGCEDHRLFAPWSREEGPGIGPLEDRSKLLDVFFKKWDTIVIAELGLRKADSRKFWKSYDQAVRDIWPEAAGMNTFDAQAQCYAQAVLGQWKAVERM